MKNKLRVYKLYGHEIGETEMLSLSKVEGFDGEDLTSAYRYLVNRGVEIQFTEYRDALLKPNGDAMWCAVHKCYLGECACN